MLRRVVHFGGVNYGTLRNFHVRDGGWIYCNTLYRKGYLVNVSEVLTNLPAATNGFQQLSGWGYVTPASSYFFAGLIAAVAFGVVMLGVRWVRACVGGGGNP